MGREGGPSHLLDRWEFDRPTHTTTITKRDLCTGFLLLTPKVKVPETNLSHGPLRRVLHELIIRSEVVLHDHNPSGHLKGYPVASLSTYVVIDSVTPQVNL